MRLIAFLKLCITLLVLHVAVGDLVLPEPYRQNSKQVRHSINHYLVSLLPEKKLLNF